MGGQVYHFLPHLSLYPSAVLTVFNPNVALGGWERDDPLKKQSNGNPGFEHDPNIFLMELFMPLCWDTNVSKVAVLASSPLDLHDKFREK